MQDALVVVDLVERGRALGAVAAPTRGMERIALDPVDAAGLVVHVTHEPAGRLAVEAGGGHQGVMLLHSLRPSLGVESDRVVPRLMGRIVLQVSHGSISGYDRGTDCPARTKLSS